MALSYILFVIKGLIRHNFINLFLSYKINDKIVSRWYFAIFKDNYKVTGIKKKSDKSFLLHVCH